MRCMSVVCQIINPTAKIFLSSCSISENEFDGRRNFPLFIYHGWTSQKKDSNEFFIFIFTVQSMPSNKLKFHFLMLWLANASVEQAFNFSLKWMRNVTIKFGLQARQFIYFLPTLFSTFCVCLQILFLHLFFLFFFIILSLCVSALWQYHSISLNVKLRIAVVI